MFKKKSVGISAGIIKKMLCAAAVIICCIMPTAISASAAEVNEIKLEANGSEASLELYFPQAAAEGIASMQMSVYVTANSDSAALEFIPDSGLSAKIVESRYQSDTGTLNIYLAGTEALFSSYGSTKVGTIKISASDSSAASAAVEVVKDSVRFVRSGELVSPDSDTDYPASVIITAAGQASPVTPDPVYPNYPTGNYFPNIYVSTDIYSNRNDTDETRRPVNDGGYTEPDAESGGYDAVLEDEDTIGENPNPPDTSALSDALSRADGYRKTDYTDGSYDELKEAEDKAKELISDPNATQDDIDEALLNVENAIGMLNYRNDIPSGAEGYGKNNEYGADGVYYGDGGEDYEYGQGEQPYGVNSPNYGINGNGVQTPQNGDIVNASDEVQPVSDPFAGNDNGGKNPVLWIIVISAIAVAAAAASIIVLKKANKKKSAGGNHFKSE